jgi:hypothetical protein
MWRRAESTPRAVARETGAGNRDLAALYFNIATLTPCSVEGAASLYPMVSRADPADFYSTAKWSLLDLGVVPFGAIGGQYPYEECCHPHSVRYQTPDSRSANPASKVLIATQSGLAKTLSRVKSAASTDGRAISVLTPARDPKSEGTRPLRNGRVFFQWGLSHFASLVAAPVWTSASGSEASRRSISVAQSELYVRRYVVCVH